MVGMEEVRIGTAISCEFLSHLLLPFSIFQKGGQKKRKVDPLMATGPLRPIRGSNLATSLMVAMEQPVILPSNLPGTHYRTDPVQKKARWVNFLTDIEELLGTCKTWGQGSESGSCWLFLIGKCLGCKCFQSKYVA